MTYRQSRVKKSASWTSAATAYGAIISMVQIGILARQLEPMVFGQFALLNAAIEILRSLSAGGMSSYLVFNREISDHGKTTVYFMTLAFGILCMSAIYVLAPYIVILFGQPAIADDLRTLSILLVVNSLCSQYQAIGLRNFEHPTISKIDIFSRSLGLLAALLTMHLGLFCLIVSAISVALTRLLLLSHLFSKYSKIRFAWDSLTARDAFNYGKFQIGGASINIIRKQLDVLILGLTLPINDLGVYHLLKQLASKPGQVIQPSINNLAMPILSELRNHKARLREAYLDVVLATSVLLALIYAPIICFSSEVALLAFGDSYAQYYLLLSLLTGFWYVRIAGPTAMGALILATGNTKLTFVWNVMTLPVSVLVIAFSSSYGVYHLCCGLLGLQLMLMPLSNLYVVRKVVDISTIYVAKLIVLPMVVFASAMGMLAILLQMEFAAGITSLTSLALAAIVQLLVLGTLYKKSERFRSHLLRVVDY